MINIKTVSIIGAGAMGWGIAYILSSYRKARVKIWDRNPKLISEAIRTGINSRNSSPEIKMPEDALFSTDLKETTRSSDLVLLAVPSFAVREICQKLADFAIPPMLMISKGMEKDTSLLPFQIAGEILKKQDMLHVTGAGYGKEVHKKIPTTEALASKDENLLEEVRKLLETDWLTIRTSTDLLGVQLAGALKNVMVIGIGMTLCSKENPELRSKLINEGVQEMIRMGKAMGAKEETFQGPAGKGDLEISADPLSRNYKLGQSLIEKGISEVVKGLQEKGVTVEGFHTAFAAHRLAQQYQVQLSIIDEVYRVIYENKNPQLSVEVLLKLAKQA